MPFETIDNLKAVSAQIGVFPDGVRVQARKMKGNKGSHYSYIKVTVGPRLAAKLVWRDESQRIDLAFGTGKDAGKIRASVNQSSGQFVAKRDKSGRYVFTINAATAEGLFALDFPTFDIEQIEPVCEMNVPPALVFKASDAMLAVD
jgi:hypothetical protein